jgi:muramidase (phage lysozyme)
MTDLAQALSEIKSLPDEALQRELASPTGMIPGYLVLGEMHERKSLRAGTGPGATAKKPKSLAAEYIGDVSKYVTPPPPQMPPQQPPQMPSMGGPPPMAGGMPPQGMPQGGGISSLPPPVKGYARGGITTLGSYNPDVDPRLYAILQQAATTSPYEVRLISGRREGDPRFHGKGMATDIQLYDPATGQVLDNYQSGKYFSQYQQFANEARRAQMQQYPELADKFRWGGYFSGPKGKYGALDLMHFDVGGVPTAGGTWESGITPQQAAQYGIDMSQNVGYNSQGQPVVYASASGDPTRRAFLDTIAGTEATKVDPYTGYYGGGHFRGFESHPNIRVPIAGTGDYSTAAGRYQITKGTWDDLVKAHGYKDFSPQTQDEAAWQLAQDRYGAGLQEALASGDPQKLAEVQAQLGSTWKGLAGQKNFADVYAQNLAAAQANPTAVASAGVEAAQPQISAQAADTAGSMAAAESGNPMAEYLLMSQLLGQQQQQQAPAPAAPVQAQPTTPFDPSQFVQNPFFMRRRVGYG